MGAFVDGLRFFRLRKGEKPRRGMLVGSIKIGRANLPLSGKDEEGREDKSRNEAETKKH